MLHFQDGDHDIISHRKVLHTASAPCIYSSVHQFLIGSTLVAVLVSVQHSERNTMCAQILSPYLLCWSIFLFASTRSSAGCAPVSSSSVLTRPRWCGVRWQSQLPHYPILVAGASIEPVSAVLHRQWPWCRHPFSKNHVMLFRCQLLLYGSFATYIDMSPMTASSLLWCPLCILGWTVATLSLSGFLPVFNDASRPFSMLQRVWRFDFSTVTTWPMSSWYYTGCVS